jgi:hypothetical protein|uniref:Uncharacterized protein n=1 Tax=Picea glauca TaxID=3330 RepID=A0A117NIF0_PICGL|nr:hypothetical protein ABT39_MTgene3078 [Picea glauca]QHR87301.1 hypothetical protein Q903MT_gene1311 [Picea sitchensis]
MWLVQLWSSFLGDMAFARGYGGDRVWEDPDCCYVDGTVLEHLSRGEGGVVRP